MELEVDTLKPLLDPRNIAIIGASSDLTRIGGLPIKSLVDFNFQGKIFPVNPKYVEIAGLKCYSTISQVPCVVDLAIIVLPSYLVLHAVRDCGEQGVKSIIVMSAGFSEIGEQGKRNQDELTKIAKNYQMRVLGPNTVGMFNLQKGAIANFALTPSLGSVPKGRIGIVSQSGAFCGYIYTLAAQKQIGLNYFIGTGNEADIDVADCIAYLAQDENTDVIAVYLEGCKDGKKFIASLEMAKRNKKPVIILKVGKSEIGSKAALSHTASLVGEDASYDAVFKQTGAYRVESIQELLDVSYACSFGRLPQGKNIAIFTVSGGAGVMMADYLAFQDLNLPQPDESVRKKLLQLVPFASVQNPIDFTGHLVNNPKLLGEFLREVLDNRTYDMIVTFTGIQGYKEEAFAELLSAMNDISNEFPHIPQLLTTLFTQETKKKIHKIGIPVFDDPITMVNVAKALCYLGNHFYQSTKSETHWEKKKLDLSLFTSSALTEGYSKQLLQNYDIPVTNEKVVKTEEEAVQIANEIGYPVALKGMSPQILHKTEANLVQLNVNNDIDVFGLFSYIRETILQMKDAEFEGVLVQEMLDPPVAEIIVGSKTDQLFGPMIMVGLGGIFLEAFKDVSIRKAPVDKNEALKMIQELRGFSILNGLRGQSPGDIEALCDLITSLSHLVTDYADEIEEVDINPVMVYPLENGVMAADALIKLKQQHWKKSIKLAENLN
ncbi:acetate--CoA ligase family protein [Bacillus sp. EB600]|uniref:acetate--CoA ligase family protein n=1 Tax=Bacillus sp. EB600 TaxID=2806345 RepID=UPI00210A7B78|nr:acetate--CoA ligase family protein [Bacillus sp. EB600]MCQ6279591.1 acetate--CoA ligase family protein [Bacillus sp. EB600]